MLVCKEAHLESRAIRPSSSKIADTMIVATYNELSLAKAADGGVPWLLRERLEARRTLPVMSNASSINVRRPSRPDHVPLSAD